MTRTAALIIELVALTIYTALVYDLGKRMGRTLEQRETGSLHRWSPVPHWATGPTLIAVMGALTVILWNAAK